MARFRSSAHAAERRVVERERVEGKHATVAAKALSTRTAIRFHERRPAQPYRNICSMVVLDGRETENVMSAVSELSSSAFG
jgi:hypothetical protein